MPTHDEQNELNNLNSFYRPVTQARSTDNIGWFRKHRRGIGIGSAITTALITSSIFFLARPLEIVHFAKLLDQFHFSSNEDESTSRLTKAYRYFKYRDQPHMKRLGTVANKWADHLELRMKNELGIEPRYERGFGQGFDVVDPIKANNISLEELDRLGIEYEVHTEGEFKGELKSIKLDLENVDLTQAKTRKTIRYLMGKLGYSRAIAAIQARPYIKRFGASFSVFSRPTRAIKESFSEFWRGERTDKLKNGEINYDAKGKKKVDEDGKEFDDPDTKSVAEDVNHVTGDVKVPSERIEALKGRLSKGVVTITILCIIKALAEGADQIEYLQTQLPMMRLGVRVVAAGNQIMAGENVDVQELEEESSYFYDKVEGTSWTNARSIQHELGQPLTGPDIPESAKFGGTKNIVSKFLDSIPGVGEACEVVNSTVGQIVSFVVDKVVLGWIGAIANWLGSLALSHSPLFKAIMNLAAGEPVNVEAKGAEMGNYANYGARLAANDRALITGGRKLSANEEGQVGAVSRANLREGLDEKGWGYRIFAIAEPDSIISQLLGRIPRPSELASYFSPLKFATSAFTPANWAFGGKLRAAEEYDYGFSKIGFSIKELNDKRWDNPYENASLVEPKLDEPWVDPDDHSEHPVVHQPLNQEYGKACFGILGISGDGKIDFGNEPKGYGEVNPIDSKCTGDYQWLVRYRIYILDLMSQTAAACQEGDEASCTNLGLVPAESDTGGDSEISGDVQQLAKDMLENPNITYWTNNGVNTRDVVEALSKGRPAYTTATPTTCPQAPAPSQTTEINPNILKFLVAAGKKTDIQVNALTDKCHSSSASAHYTGEAVDLEDTAPLNILLPIAGKYGGTKNTETGHYHFDFPK